MRQHLQSLKRGRYVVLHGMTGSGKSCLAAAALDNKQLIIEKFKVRSTNHSSHNIYINYFYIGCVVGCCLSLRPRVVHVRFVLYIMALKMAFLWVVVLTY